MIFLFLIPIAGAFVVWIPGVEEQRLFASRAQACWRRDCEDTAVAADPAP